jgi:molybdopterin synthase sulfur carrier subunit
MNTGRIEISLYASLRKWNPSPAFTHEIAEGKTVGEILVEIGVPERDTAIIMVNQRRGGLDTILSSGDTLSLFPLIGGG